MIGLDWLQQHSIVRDRVSNPDKTNINNHIHNNNYYYINHKMKMKGV